jgi:hypothetical protein
MISTSREDRTAKVPPTIVQILTICDDDEMQILGFIGILDDGEFRAFANDGERIGTFRKLKVAYRAVVRRAA